MVREPAQQGADDIIVARFTYVGRAQTQCFGPQLVVRQPVRADDAKVGKFMMQTLDFVRSRSFQIQDHRFGAIPGNRGTNFLVSAS